MAAIIRTNDFTAERDAGSPSNVISADKVDAELDNLVAGVNNRIDKDGSVAAAANLPLGGFKLTGHNTAAPAARSDSVSAANIQDNGLAYAVAGGTADALTATFTPNVTLLADGMELCISALLANATTTPTFAAGTTAAKTIVKGAGTALVAGDIAGATHQLRLRYKTSADKWFLLNPIYPGGTFVSADSLNSLTTDTTIGATGDFIPFVDVSDSNASNKGTLLDLLRNMMANVTTKASAAAADKFLIGDSAAGGTAKITTLAGLTADAGVSSPGYHGMPQNAQSGSYGIVLADAGKSLYHTGSAATYTIPANGTIAMDVGTIIGIVNAAGASDVTVAITSDTLQRGDGIAGTGSRTVPASSLAFLYKATSTVWYIYGAFT